MSLSPVRIFIAYARKDKAFLDDLRKHLQPLERSQRVKLWYDKDIEAGAEWEESIKKELNNANIILLLVSANAINSNYFYDNEMTGSLRRHENGEASVVPIILRPCDWEETPWGKLQALPKDGKPIELWVSEAEAYTNIVKQLKPIVANFEKKGEQAAIEKARVHEDAISKNILSINSDLRTLNLEKQNEEAIRNQKLTSLEKENAFNRDMIAKLQNLQTLNLEKQNEEVVRNQKLTNLEKENAFNRDMIAKLQTSLESIKSERQNEQEKHKMEVTGLKTIISRLEQLRDSQTVKISTLRANNQSLNNTPATKNWTVKIKELLPNFLKIARNPIYFLFSAFVLAAVIYNLIPKEKDSQAITGRKKDEAELLAAQKGKNENDKLSKVPVTRSNLSQNCDWIQDKNNRGIVHYRGSRYSVTGVLDEVASRLDNKQGFEACRLAIKEDMCNYNRRDIESNNEAINDKKTNGIKDIIIHVPLNCIPSALATNEVVVDDEGMKKNYKPKPKLVTYTEVNCDRCNGSGLEGNKKCGLCAGRGLLRMAKQ